MKEKRLMMGQKEVPASGTIRTSTPQDYSYTFSYATAPLVHPRLFSYFTLSS